MDCAAPHRDTTALLLERQTVIRSGRETGRPDLVFGAILLLAVLGKLTDGAMRWLEHWLLGWRDTLDKAK